MKEKTILEEVGLAKNEGKVYSELVKYGKLSASEASLKSGVPYGKIYVVLEGLVEKGLAKIVPEKVKKYSPTSPEFLIDLINKKESTLERAREKVLEMKQSYENKEKDFLVIGRGEKGFWKVVDEMRKPTRYDYSIKWDSKIRPNALNEARKALKREISSRDLVRYDNETKKNVHKWLRVQKNIRKFPNEGIAFSIIDDQEVLITLITKNTTLLIKDVPFAKVMKKLFLDSYKNSEEIK